MVGHHHPVGMSRRADALHVGHLRRPGEAHSPAGIVGPPAQVHVLVVHEVGLVEATQLLQRAASGQEARAGHPPGAGDHVPLGGARVVAQREGVLRIEQRQQRVPGGIGEGGEVAYRGIDLTGLGEDARPDQRPGACSVSRAWRSAASAPGWTTRSGLQTRIHSGEDDLARQAARPRFTPAPKPTLRPGRTMLTGHGARAGNLLEGGGGAAGAPFSTTTTGTAPSPRRERTQPSSNGPASWSTTTAATMPGTRCSVLPGEAELDQRPQRR